MPLDALFLSALRQELAPKLIGARVDKIQQPERDTVILQVHNTAFSAKLLISASVNHPRIHFSSAPYENPAQPPMFCMLLRKHLSGSRILSVEQPPMERLIDVTFDTVSEMGERSEKHLVLELMGRNSNLLLLDAERRIMECLRRVDFEMSEQRQVLPGLFYHLPPAQEKQNPFLLSPEEVSKMLINAPDGVTFDRFLFEHFGGFSPLICRELSYRLFCSTEVRMDMLTEDARIAAGEKLAKMLTDGALSYSPTMLCKDGTPKDFSCIPIFQYENAMNTEEYPSFCELLDSFYTERDNQERIRSKTQAIRKTVQNLIQRTARKLEMQKQELSKTKNREQLRRMGDILTANLYAVSRGQEVISVVDFYDPEMKTVEIRLNPAISPQQNAAKFYKDYQKAKTAEKMLTEQIASGEQELLYLESTLDCLSRAASERDIAEIRQELIDGKYLRPNGNKKQMKLPPSKPMHFVTADGFDILVGRNNRQNDLLTLKTANRHDYWLHTQKIHGSHVILVCNGAEPSDDAFTAAAMLAAKYSQGADGQNIPVDCTLVKNVKKPNGAKPGMVIYDHYRTIYVTPSENVLEKLKKES